jgi:hypothetical protein
MNNLKLSSIIILILSILSLSFVSCEKSDIARGTPDCIITKIGEFEPVACEDGKVDKYTFQGETVYVFDHGIECGADLSSEVVLEDCTHLGYLGGISGNTIINGENFSSAEFEKNIWKK